MLDTDSFGAYLKLDPQICDCKMCFHICTTQFSVQVGCEVSVVRQAG